MDSHRKDFLFKMYDQMFNDINRHILVVWQSVGVIVGAFAIFAFVEKNIISSDIACSIILILTSWSIAHTLDASYWYNRNLVIIANIERHFLTQDDTKFLHYYFSSHRKDNKMISHLRIQVSISVGLAVLVFLYHFTTRIYPTLFSSWDNLELLKSSPYILLILSMLFLKNLSDGKDKRYAEFLARSPGLDIESEAEGALGHGQ